MFHALHTGCNLVSAHTKCRLFFFSGQELHFPSGISSDNSMSIFYRRAVELAVVHQGHIELAWQVPA